MIKAGKRLKDVKVEVKHINYGGAKNMDHYNKRIEAEVEQAKLLKELLTDAAERKEKARKTYECAWQAYDCSKKTVDELRSELNELKLQERMLQDKFRTEIDQAKDIAYKKWKEADEQSRKLYARVGELKKEALAAYESNNHALLHELNLQKERMVIEQKCAINIKKIALAFFRDKGWIDEVCPDILPLIARIRDIKMQLEAKSTELIRLKNLMNKAREMMEMSGDEYREIVQLSICNFSEQKKAEIEGLEKQYIKEYLGVKEECIVYSEGAIMIHVIYGGVDTPDGDGHGHIVMNNSTKKIIYKRDPLDKIN